MLLKRIRSKQNKAVLVGDEAPAGARRGAARLGVRPPDGVDERPVDKGNDDLDQYNREQQGKQRIPGEKPFHRSTRALYQFISTEMERLIVRYTAMMIAMPSIAWPVWFIVVFAMDTRSG